MFKRLLKAFGYYRCGWCGGLLKIEDVSMCGVKDDVYCKEMECRGAGKFLAFALFREIHDAEFYITKDNLWKIRAKSHGG